MKEKTAKGGKILFNFETRFVISFRMRCQNAQKLIGKKNSFVHTLIACTAILTIVNPNTFI